MSSPPLSEPGNRAGLFYQAAGSFVSELACPRPWSRIRKHPGAPRFVLATWPSCRGTRELVASELAVVPSTTSGSPSLNTWPARPRHASSGHNLPLTRLRAIHRVPSYLAVRADPEHLTSPRSVAPPSRSKLAQRAGSVSQHPIVALKRGNGPSGPHGAKGMPRCGRRVGTTPRTPCLTSVLPRNDPVVRGTAILHSVTNRMH
jgi:hypothetical protein